MVIEKKPDPKHKPAKGDKYISRVLGVTMTVTAVGKKGGTWWVVSQTPSGMRYKQSMEQFRNTNRRIV